MRKQVIQPGGQSIITSKAFSLLPMRQDETTPNVSPAPRPSDQSMLAAYGENPWLHIKLVRQCSAIAGLDFKVQARDPRTGELDPLAYDYPMWKMLRRPNPIMRGWDFRFLSELYARVTGEVFWQVMRGGFAPLWLYLWPRNWVQPIYDRGRVSEYVVRAQTQGFATQFMRVSPRDMIWLRVPDPLEPYTRGLGDVLSMATEIDTYELASESDRRFFKRDAQPGGALVIPGMPDTQERRRILDDWKETVNPDGVAEGGNVPILAGGMDYKQFRQGRREMDFIEGQRMLRDFIITGVHKHIMGISDDVTFANAKAADYTFAQWDVSPRVRWWADNLNEQLAPFFDDRATVVFANPVPQDEAFELERATKGIQIGTVKRNEWREKNGYPPLPGDEGDVYILPITMIEVPADRTGERMDAQTDPQTGRPDQTPVQNPNPNEEKPKPANERPPKPDKALSAASPVLHSPDDSLSTRIGKDLVSFFVSRRLLNADEFIRWARTQGVAEPERPEDLHVTVMWSKTPADDVVPDENRLTVEGGERSAVRLGDDGAVVLMFESAALTRRWGELQDAGATWEYDTYHPHITIAYDPDKKIDPASIEVFKGALEFGPERFEEVETAKLGAGHIPKAEAGLGPVVTKQLSPDIIRSIVGRLDEESHLVMQRMQAAYLQVFRDRYVDVAQELGLDFIPDLVDRRAIEYIKDGAWPRIVGANETTFAAIHETLEAGAKVGDDIFRLQERVTSVFQDAKGFRAHRIARQEALYSSNTAALNAYQQSGAVEKVEWLLAPDYDPQDDDGECGELDGAVTVIGDNFGGTDVQNPPLHIMCRCALAPIVSEAPVAGDKPDEPELQEPEGRAIEYAEDYQASIYRSMPLTADERVRVRREYGAMVERIAKLKTLERRAEIALDSAVEKVWPRLQRWIPAENQVRLSFGNIVGHGYHKFTRLEGGDRLYGGYQAWSSFRVELNSVHKKELGRVLSLQRIETAKDGFVYGVQWHEMAHALMDGTKISEALYQTMEGRSTIEAFNTVLGQRIAVTVADAAGQELTREAVIGMVQETVYHRAVTNWTAFFERGLNISLEDERNLTRALRSLYTYKVPAGATLEPGAAIINALYAEFQKEITAAGVTFQQFGQAASFVMERGFSANVPETLLMSYLKPTR